ncbi:MAG: metal-sulfur cluster assembly factor [Bryobacterales bacterium]|nr:metal-sulfur cluster assembly factor [Bryobacterales bacterium]
MKETQYAHRTDGMEEKLRLLEAALRNRNFELIQSLAESLKDTAGLARLQAEPGPPVMPAEAFGRVDELPAPWRRWARGWEFYKVLTLDETVGLARSGEPVECLLSFPAGRIAAPFREIRLAWMDEAAGQLREIPCQVSQEAQQGGERFCRLAFRAASPAHVRTHYLVFYGNPDAELTGYPTDLQVSGEGYGLDIQNEYFRASLSRQMGQLERLEYRHGGLVLHCSGEGHGEPPGIDWAHDYVTSNNFQKLRVTNWADCPNYEVVRGPVCVKIRRWGFPHSTVHPLFTPSRIHMMVEYQFFAGVPYFVKQGTMEVIKDLEITYLRDDEWVLSGFSFTDPVWMAADGKLHIGPVEPAQRDNLWAVGFFHRENRNAFIGLHLVHEAERFDGLKHSGTPDLNYLKFGQIWSRWAASGNPTLSTGAVLRQKNAYLLAPFPVQGGPEFVEGVRHRLLNPLVPGGGSLARGLKAAEVSGTLARPGEAGDSPIPKAALWSALRECKDDQLYTIDANVVDMGYIYDVRVRGGLVHIVMTMPHRGRPRYRFLGNPIRQRLLKLPGVSEVLLEHVWEPAWSVHRLTEAGRRAVGI